VLAGLVLAALALARPRGGPDGELRRRVAAVLLLFAVLFAVGMTFGAKKFDRYLLPVYPPLDLVAAMGWVAAARRLEGLGLGRAGPAALGGIAIAGQLAVAVPAFPYYFSYYNPLLGGPARAPEVMMVGWGEGLDQAARYLNAQPAPERLRAAAWVWNGTFSYFFKGESLTNRFAPDSASLRQWRDTDYCVLYINQRQRGRLPPELLEYVDKLDPVMTVRIQGLEYARVYDLREAPVPGYLTGNRAAAGSQDGGRHAQGRR
jgi:4-amino-4-deoxy-L-arabinose transferase-like glycosyltransferase